MKWALDLANMIEKIILISGRDLCLISMEIGSLPKSRSKDWKVFYEDKQHDRDGRYGLAGAYGRQAMNSKANAQSIRELLIDLA